MELFNKKSSISSKFNSSGIEYTYAYALPTDNLRVLKVHNGTTASVASDLDYKIEGNNIVTDEGTVYIVFVAVDADPNNYDAYLYEAISHQLAADLCYAITNNSTLANNYMARADERLREASFIDATENSLDTVEANEFTDARL